MKNNFAWKLTFSILQIVCIVPPISICGIVSCVFTAKSNTAYLDGRMEAYKKQACASTIALLTGLVFIMLTAGTVAFMAATDVWIRYSVESKTNREIQEEGNVPLSETKLADYNVFILEGSDVTLPMTFDELGELNLKVEQGEKLSQLVNSGDSAYATLYTGDDELLGLAFVFNDGESPKALNQCMVTSLEIYNNSILYSPEIELIKEVTFNSEKEELFDYFGEPDKDYIAEENNYAYYTWYPPSYKQNGRDALTVTFSNGKISNIKVTYLGIKERRK